MAAASPLEPRGEAGRALGSRESRQSREEAGARRPGQEPELATSSQATAPAPALCRDAGRRSQQPGEKAAPKSQSQRTSSGPAKTRRQGGTSSCVGGTDGPRAPTGSLSSHLFGEGYARRAKRKARSQARPLSTSPSGEKRPARPTQPS